MTRCFWPRYHGFHTSKKADAELAPMIDAGGIYLIADSGQQAPASLHPSDPSVIYVGETSRFKRRMGQFGDSAGLWDDGLRTPGHSAGFRVKLQRDRLWLTFFSTWSTDLPACEDTDICATCSIWMALRCVDSGQAACSSAAAAATAAGRRGAARIFALCPIVVRDAPVPCEKCSVQWRGLSLARRSHLEPQVSSLVLPEQIAGRIDEIEAQRVSAPSTHADPNANATSAQGKSPSHR